MSRVIRGTAPRPILTHRDRHISHISRIVVERARPVGVEDRHSAVTLTASFHRRERQLIELTDHSHEERPLVRRRMPMQLAHRPRLERHFCSGDLLRRGEVGRVGDLDRAAVEALGLHLRHGKDELVRDLALRGIREGSAIGRGG